MQLENRENDTGLLSGLITARNLSKGFTNGAVRIEILRDLNFDLSAGETVAIVGASGIGKSTLLHILGTLDRPDSGQLLFKGEDVFSYDDVTLARFRNKSVGFVFQFHKNTTVRNIPAVAIYHPEGGVTEANPGFNRDAHTTTSFG